MTDTLSPATDHPVRTVLAKLARCRPADLSGHRSLGSLGLSSSFGLGALRSRLEAQGHVRLPAIDLKLTVDALCQLVDAARGGVAATTPTPAPSQTLAADTTPASAVVDPAPLAIPVMGMGVGMGLGMDLQEITVLPDVTDLRSDPFYAGHFLPDELATATLRPDPRAHLAGVFCAKEAAKKSHPALLPLRMTDLHLRHDAAGRPMLSLRQPQAGAPAFSFLVSISHSGSMAAATCVTTWPVNGLAAC